MTKSNLQTPRDLGYRMPAEWERHAATWLAWPHNSADWPGKFQPIPWVYCEIVRRLAEVETVHIAVQDGASEKRAIGQLARAGAALQRVHFHPWPTNRVWTRDSGPIFIRRKVAPSADSSDNRHREAQEAPEDTAPGSQEVASEVAVLDWRFNAWAKYDDWRLDDQLPGRVAKLLGLKSWQPVFSARAQPDVARQPELEPSRVVLEGGSIDGNGEGTLLTTEECLLSEVQQRNPGRGREEMEQVFREYLGIDQVLWLNRGIAGDDTHGHVDDIARFVSPTTIVAAAETNTHDENHLPLAENLERLRTARNLEGKPYRIVELPLPAPVVFEGRRLPASYANFYLANGIVLVPTFNDPNDRHALSILADLFPERQVTGIYSGDLVWGLGTLHCMTQQQPAAASDP